jgi:DNA-binding MarR family transcriptional regulator
MNFSREQFANSYLVYGLIRGLNFVIENDLRSILKNRELTVPSFRILWILFFDSNIRMSELTFLAQTNISNVFRQLTKLEEAGLVSIKSGDDARTRELSLTEDGRRIVQDFIDQNTRKSDLQIVHLIESIPKEDFTTFIRVASLLTNKLVGNQFNEFVTKSSTEIYEEDVSTH